MQSTRSSNTRGQRRGYVMFLTAVSSALIMGAMGFAIDTGVLYTVRAKLTAACDGAALAAARNLNVGLTMAQQEVAARTRATSFYNANFPSQFLGATRHAPTINIPTTVSGSVLTVTTSGSATVGTYFMRYFGTGDVLLKASGTASRRDLNMMLVLDRSVSMKDGTKGGVNDGPDSSCEVMKLKAKEFVGNFVENRDQIGLITFGANIVTALVPTKVNFKTKARDLISKIYCGDNTAMTLAYWAAYQELVKLAQPSALNVIMLFTDGNPNGIYAKYETDKAKGGSGCNSNEIIGVLARSTSNAPISGKLAGLYQPFGTSITNHGTSPATGVGCGFRKDPAQPVVDDIAGMPDFDVNGNRLRGYPNQYVDMSPYMLPNGLIKDDSPRYNLYANKNTMDHAAMRVRDRVSNPNIGVVTFVIGLGSYSLAEYEQPDDVLLRRVANDPAGQSDPNSVYRNIPDMPNGMYIRATNHSQLSEAFQRIASEVLRISK